MPKRSEIRDNTLFIIHLAVIARVLIFIKGILMASKIGVSYRLDAYILALGAIMFITKIVGDGIITALIPIYQEIQNEEGIAKKVEYTNNLVNLSIMISIVLIGVGYFGAPIIVTIFGPGLGGEELANSIDLFRAGLPIISLSWLRAIGGAYLQSEHAFRAGAKGGVAYEIAFIIYLFFFAEFFTLRGLMVAGMIGIIWQIKIILDAIKIRGYRYHFRLDIGDENIRKMVVLLFPLIIGVGVNEVNNAVDTAIASVLPAGSIARLDYASQIVNLFISLFVIAIVTVIFPVMSESHTKKNFDSLKSEIHRGVKTLLIISIPVAIILFIMAEPVVKIFFERGAFDVDASFFTSEALIYYAIGLPAMALMPLMARTYYSIKDTKTPVIITGLVMLINVALDLTFAPIMGASGMALGTSLATIIGAIIGFLDLNVKLNLSETANIRKMTIRLFISSLAMIIGIVLVYKLVPVTGIDFTNNLILVFSSSIIGVSLYTTAYRLIKI